MQLLLLTPSCNNVFGSWTCNVYWPLDWIELPRSDGCVCSLETNFVVGAFVIKVFEKGNVSVDQLDPSRNECQTLNWGYYFVLPKKILVVAFHGFTPQVTTTALQQVCTEMQFEAGFLVECCHGFWEVWRWGNAIENPWKSEGWFSTNARLQQSLWW